MLNRKESGFTLIELLIVLSALSILLLIGHQIYRIDTSERDFESWYHQFELDLIYLQKSSMITDQYIYLLIQPNQNYYTITTNPILPPIVKRDIPEDWDVQMNTLNGNIRFSHSGQIINPGTMRIIINDNQYSIYFPFGKGRSYYVKR